jgi:hypothetical protein
MRCLGEFARWFPQVVPGAAPEVTDSPAWEGAPAAYPIDFRFSIVMQGDGCLKDRVCLPNVAPSRKNQA